LFANKLKILHNQNGRFQQEGLQLKSSQLIRLAWLPNSWKLWHHHHIIPPVLWPPNSLDLNPMDCSLQDLGHTTRTGGVEDQNQERPRAMRVHLGRMG